MSPARFAPHRPLPAIAFVPGRTSKSLRPTAVHPTGQALPPERWRENETWLFGADLYNQGFLWEAHEAWEHLWRAPFDPDQALFLQGLIQCAAAGLKIAVEERRGAARLARDGVARLESVPLPGTGRYMGLDARAFASAFRAFAASEPPTIEGRPLIELA